MPGWVEKSVAAFESRPTTAVGAGQLRQPEVEDLDLTVVADHHVRRLQIAVDDILRVGCSEGSAQWHRNLQQTVDVEPVGGNQRVEGLALHQLHAQEVDSVGFLHRMDRDDVGVLQGGQDLSFSQEPSQQIAVARERIGQQLESDFALELRVSGSVYLAHATHTDAGEDLVGADSSATLQGHRKAQQPPSFLATHPSARGDVPRPPLHGADPAGQTRAARYASIDGLSQRRQLGPTAPLISVAPRKPNR